MLFTHFLSYIRKEKQKPGLYLHQAGNTFALNPQIFYQ